MSQSDSLRKREEQHKAKNTVSKEEDKAVIEAAERVIDYLQTRFQDTFFNNHDGSIRYVLQYERAILIKDMIAFITRKGYRKWEEFNHAYDHKEIRPDGGVIYLIKQEVFQEQDGDQTIEKIVVKEKLPLVIAEVKHQGTNVDRLQEGKPMQAIGNAIERLGKNLSGIKAMMHYESITPFICFGDGCDFARKEDVDQMMEQLNQLSDAEKIEIREKFENGALTVQAKIFVMNDFYELNKMMIFKKHKSLDDGPFAPVSMMFRYAPWSVEEMFEYMKEIAETSFRYYMF